MKTKNDVAWEQLFDRHKILPEIQQNGIYRISAAAINAIGREARLMTKFDQRASLPDIFKKNRLSILPDSRGTYLIGDFDTYQNVANNPTAGTDEILFPSEIETIDPTNLYSEAAGLLCAYNSQMLNNLIGEEVRFTLGGRMSSGVFNYEIKTRAAAAQITVTNAQCEIDGGFESRTKLLIIEAKNYGTDDFHVRQLYYPYRLWRGKTRKQVVPVFMTVSNDVFSFYVYRFRDDAIYNSIELVEQRKYRIAPVEIELNDILDVFAQARNMPPTALPNVPFPQANSFPRVIDLLGLLKDNGFLTNDQIASNYVFAERQADYYQNAGRYLGLVQKQNEKASGDVVCTLTNEGARVMGLPTRQKFLSLTQLILRNPVFARTFELYIDNGDRPQLNDICQIMIDEKLPISGDTISRRAKGVLPWIDWILDLQHQ